MVSDSKYELKYVLIADPARSSMGTVCLTYSTTSSGAQASAEEGAGGARG